MSIFPHGMEKNRTKNQKREKSTEIQDLMKELENKEQLERHN